MIFAGPGAAEPDAESIVGPVEAAHACVGLDHAILGGECEATLSTGAADVRLIRVVGGYGGPTGVDRGDSSLLKRVQER